MITVANITNEMIAAIRDAACECRPRKPIKSNDHAQIHDCDVETYDTCVIALEATGEEQDLARHHCAAVVNDVMAHHGPGSAYWRALSPLVAAARVASAHCGLAGYCTRGPNCGCACEACIRARKGGAK